MNDIKWNINCFILEEEGYANGSITAPIRVVAGYDVLLVSTQVLVVSKKKKFEI